MARIRSIKPEFWDDRKLARSTSRDARMLYMGLWNQADEHGRLNGDVAWIKGRVFPFEDDLGADQIVTLLCELESAGRIVQYEVDGDPFIYLPKLAKHQRLEPGKVESKLPAPPSESHADSSERRADSTGPDASSPVLLYVAGSMEHGEGAPRASLSPNCSKHPNGTEAPCGPCRSARLKFENAPKEMDPERRRLAEAVRLRIDCTDCDYDGWVLDDESKPLHKCLHGMVLPRLDPLASAR